MSSSKRKPLRWLLARWYLAPASRQPIELKTVVPAVSRAGAREAAPEAFDREVARLKLAGIIAVGPARILFPLAGRVPR